MKTVVFRHTNHSERLGSLAGILDRHGMAYEYVDCFDTDLANFDPLAPGLLIVTGGAPGVYQADIYPFLSQEIAILEKRLAADLPTFGICLGSQLMAAALGSRVHPGERGMERGWYDVKVNEDGMKTPLRHLDWAQTKVLQWHVDTFDLPKGATLLASSELYPNQAFSWGQNGLAVQWHPEATPRILNGWMAEAAYSAATGKIDIPGLRADSRKYCPTMMAQVDKFFSEWLDQIGTGKKKKHA